ncbi:MAG: Ribosome-recycling factor [Candidatus Daviesbacteria bacterium GW2011_GWA1_41_61]|uniref:Ribosome-recycling factor n=1 Tax=Candidatus Daviesbacteria bacterium GW2011_GWA2_40_9 TaxID=1618424 RepID=A0A0G0X6J3_9BACT|nr:MAG: Ribosome-recycling factor [Candidatus Daviesbacteria bacterium GW2011_GWC1_40_9]KKR83252.1 MAG: Ribosome-recycling factor [Candidatus Daviesbacteria bacterium GW2011_GWA2_40_9]KKR93597.1 MAG: Ribosome-recycling factor [Candidatus Daviesbacteria bacterium GW2011_GWB1_41_15]KKS14852.1 MAG: Ribosome-recycling factor [Candidatus Daviesbacteria bacterium GW2011_GWA1_41_61]
MDPVLTEANQRIQAALDHLKRELAAIRAGRANPSLIEEIPVNSYGSRMKLQEVGTISAPQPNLLTIQVWDVGVVQDVIKAIQEANLGLNPSSEGQIVRIPIPSLTAERREEFIKLAHQKMEQARIEIRQIRQDIREDWQKQQESGEFGEDEFRRREKILQDVVEKSIDQIEQMGKAKEEELSQV